MLMPHCWNVIIGAPLLGCCKQAMVWCVPRPSRPGVLQISHGVVCAQTFQAWGAANKPWCGVCPDLPGLGCCKQAMVWCVPRPSRPGVLQTSHGVVCAQTFQAWGAANKPWCGVCPDLPFPCIEQLVVGKGTTTPSPMGRQSDKPKQLPV